jgi:hypothetical protein
MNKQTSSKFYHMAGKGIDSARHMNSLVTSLYEPTSQQEANKPCSCTTSAMGCFNSPTDVLTEMRATSA